VSGWCFIAVEEEKAIPENKNQSDLVEYFEGEQEVSEMILATFLAEKNSEFPADQKIFQ
jgi:hypothetical protein